MIIRTTRGQQLIFRGEGGKTQPIIATMAATGHFDGYATDVLEFRQQFVQARGRQLVTRRMSDHGLPTGGAYPLYGLLQRGPLSRHISRFPRGEEFLKYAAHIFSMA